MWCTLHVSALICVRAFWRKGQGGPECQVKSGTSKRIMHSSTILTIAAALGCVLVCASAAPMTDAQVRGALGQAYARRSGLCLMRGSTRHG